MIKSLPDRHKKPACPVKKPDIKLNRNVNRRIQRISCAFYPESLKTKLWQVF